MSDLRAFKFFLNILGKKAVASFTSRVEMSQLEKQSYGPAMFTLSDGSSEVTIPVAVLEQAIKELRSKEPVLRSNG